MMDNKTLTINQNILDMEYAVRGPIVDRAAELRKQGREIIPCHIGNPQSLGQRPLTYFRQVLGFVENPGWVSRERKIKLMYEEMDGRLPDELDLAPDDILDLSESIISSTQNGLGAYTESKGYYFVRQAVAEFINQRDGFDPETDLASDPERIFLTSGASQGVKYVIGSLISSSSDGIMIPIPQYPLYSAEIKKAGGVQINYYPDEERGWLLDRRILEASYNDAVKSGVDPKAIVVINPANPTGAILDRKSMEEIIQFAREHNLLVIADEVYQENVYNGEFISFASVIGNENIPLISLHSVSKGFYGECGHRGGYLEVRNPPSVLGSQCDFVDVLTKQASVSLCSNTPGQILTYLLVNPPVVGSKSHQRFSHEKETILRGLYEKASMVREAFQLMDDVDCFGETGAMYLFPRLNKLPEYSTDYDYCLALLEETGICTVNGAGFGQKEGTQHLRVAFLPPKHTLENVLPAWIDFHNRYIYS